ELMLEYGLADSDPTDWWLTEADQDANAHRTMHFQLIIALRKGFAKRARLLIAHGVDLNKSDANYYQTPPVSFTPYQVALLYGLPDIADLIQQRGGDSTPLDPKDEFKAACMAGDRERASKLAPSILEKSPETAAEMLNEAAANGNVKAIDAMIGLGFDLNPTGARTALHAAAWSDQGEVIKRLLAAGADPKLRDPQHLTPPLVHAMYAQSQAAIDLLMAADMDIFCASALGQLSQIDARLSEDVAWLEASISRVSPGADQNQPKHWATPLWFAALNGQAEAVRHLLSKGANPALFDSAGDSIVMHLKRDGRQEIVQILEMHSH
ncbi:MAG: ankyrin repeat domain-containing protein, partial [Pseudomonadota bacterium]